MYLYSLAVGIPFIEKLYFFRTCPELCVPTFSLPWFIVEVTVWFLIFYAVREVAKEYMGADSSITENAM